MPTSSTPACSRATFTKPPMYDRGSQASSASPLAGEPSWTKSSSVVSLGRNVTVSWTKFRTAMRIGSVIGFLGTWAPRWAAGPGLSQRVQQGALPAQARRTLLREPLHPGEDRVRVEMRLGDHVRLGAAGEPHVALVGGE